jgi:hypothetical protein
VHEVFSFLAVAAIGGCMGYVIGAKRIQRRVERAIAVGELRRSVRPANIA